MVKRGRPARPIGVPGAPMLTELSPGTGAHGFWSAMPRASDVTSNGCRQSKGVGSQCRPSPSRARRPKVARKNAYSNKASARKPYGILEDTNERKFVTKKYRYARTELRTRPVVRQGRHAATFFLHR